MSLKPNGAPEGQPETKRGMSDGKRVLIAILAFFGIIFVADGILIYVGATSHDGLVEKDYYKKGLHYNDEVQARKRQAELGWTFTLTPPQKTGPGPLEIRLTDAKGKPLSGVKVSASVRRPAQDGYDQDLTLKEITPGLYRAELDLPMTGLWDLTAKVKGEADRATYHQRFTVSG